jgi:diguanylate cyclase (GGDEF)-like protein
VSRESHIRKAGLASGVSSAADDNGLADLQGEIAALHRELRLLRMANAELERVAILDTLTPLYNRRFFISALNERIVRRTRYQLQSAVLFVDVNGMKAINDSHGHAAGDFALVHAAHILASQIRSTDVAARLGGDEFALLLEGVDEDQARIKAASLEDVLSNSACVYGTVTLPLSASIGLTTISEDDREEAIINRADADMYARKRAYYEDESDQRSAR